MTPATALIAALRAALASEVVKALARGLITAIAGLGSLLGAHWLEAWGDPPAAPPAHKVEARK